MTEIKSEETQQELFWEFSREPKKKERFPSLQRTQKPILISTHIEQIILVSIIFILTVCLVFFLGVVRGKAISINSPRPVVSRPIVQKQPLARPQIPGVLPAVAPKAVSKSVPQGALEAVSKPSAQKLAAQKQMSDITKPYTIQLVTFKKQDLAQKEAVELRKSGYYSLIIPSGAYFQVCVGQYSTKEESKKDLKLFGARYKDCFLRRR